MSRQPDCMRVNPIVVAAAEAVYQREGMGPALREAVRVAMIEVANKPDYTAERELRDVANSLSAWQLHRVTS